MTLREIPNPAQVDGEPRRRWFFSHEQDLLVWFAADGSPSAFQLAYGKYSNEHAIRWKADRGFGHYAVDDGEAVRLGKESALLTPNGAFPAYQVLRRFIELAAELPPDLVAFVAERIQEHPEYREST